LLESLITSLAPKSTAFLVCGFGAESFMAHSIHQARQIQVRDLIAQQEALEPLQRPPFYVESLHGPSALAERQRLRQEGSLNRPKRGAKCGHKDYLAWRARNV